LGAAVSVTGLRLLEVWVVGVGDSVTVRVAILTVVRVGRVLVDIVVLTVAIRVGVVWVGTHSILLAVGQAVTVWVCLAVAAVKRVQSVGNFPSVW
jgi:hypothetical protein